jgi:predicted porin
MDTASSNGVNQYSGRTIGSGTTVFGGLQLRQAYWYLKSKQLGKLTVGRLDAAARSITTIGLGNQSAAAYNTVYWGTGMYLRPSGTTGHQSLLTGTVGNFFFGTDLARREGVRYDSPSLAGFTFSASWADDDVWDVALRYAAEFGGVSVAAAVGYEEDHWENCGLVTAVACTPPATFAGERDDKIVVANLSLLHVPTGLFITGAYYNRKRNGTLDQRTLATGQVINPEGSQWSIHAGIYQKFFALGRTTIYGEYIEGNDAQRGVGGGNFNLPGTLIDSEGSIWGLGVVQNIDAAAMNMYLAYRHVDVDATSVNAAGTRFNGAYDSFDFVLAGARINF